MTPKGRFFEQRGILKNKKTFITDKNTKSFNTKYELSISKIVNAKYYCLKKWNIIPGEICLG